MRVSSKSIEIHFLFLVFLALYLAICINADCIHNHEPDCDFHDNCPACQWQVLYQDDFSGADKILSTLDAPLCLLSCKYYIQSLVLPSESYRISCLSRAPPLPV